MPLQHQASQQLQLRQQQPPSFPGPSVRFKISLNGQQKPDARSIAKVNSYSEQISFRIKKNHGRCKRAIGVCPSGRCAEQ